MTLESKDIRLKKLDELKKIFPEIFEDGKINHEKLKVILGDAIDDTKEHYSFNWSGKKECYKTIKEKTNATLKVDGDESVPNGKNIFIEGDNLEALKLLQFSYHKKIKMIYIDPPYNKDKDFVYSDTWGDSIQNYLIQTDQLRDEGYTTTKTNSTGRRHTNWLNMIYPRLWLSRNLLKDDGVIFVSIDDDEVANLRKIMDEIYGEENFIGQIIWQKKKGGGNDSKFIANEHEYILTYCKNIETQENWYEEYDTEYLKRYKEKDEDGRFFWDTLQRRGLQSPIIYDIEASDGSIITGEWVVSEKRFYTDREKGKIRVKKLPSGKWSVQFKQYMGEGKKPRSILNSKEVGLNSEAKNTIKELFSNDKLFSNPKPVTLIKQFLKIITSKDDIILDFFAGSGTTAQAVMDLNKDDKGSRKYILVQLPEATDKKSEAYKAGYKKISDITKERIKRAMKKLDYKEGFKSFYLDNSNFQIFKEVKKRPDMSYEEIEKMLKMSMFHENILTQGAKELDIVYEIGLKNGFTLSADIKNIKSEKYNFTILTEDNRSFYFSLDRQINGDIINDIPADARLICYEKSLDTNTKLNLRENLNLEVL